MCSHKFPAAICLHLILLITTVIADLNADKQALLAFAALIPHGKKLNWNSDIDICSLWTGVRCAPDKTRVVSLKLPRVGLLGPIPANTLGKLDALLVLSLQSNGLASNIPADVSSLSSLHFLFLQHNNLSGGISGLLTSELRSFDLSFNSFTGEIPSSIQNLTRLKSLYLQHNSLSGPIPDLKLPKLKKLNLSSNNFSGPIPISLQRFPKESFLGNSLLCGLPLEQCPGLPPSSPSPSPPREDNKSFWKKLSLKVIIAISVSIFALLLLVIIILLICILRIKNRECSKEANGKVISIAKDEIPKEDYSSGIQEFVEKRLVFFEDCSSNFDLEDLLRASAEILGKGSYGTTYKAVLEDGTILVTKRLKEMVVGKREFEQQMEMIRRIGQHPNIIPLRAYYCSKDEKLLVYEYISTGSFASLLHAENNGNVERTPLNWASRVKIALETARGISHIHAEDSGKFVHGNIKSSNILLTQELRASVTDFGLSSFMSMPTSSRIIAGYRAPETIESRKFTQKSDIYSFGVLLLELLTGKAPVRSPGHGDITDLVRWVQSVLREEWTAEVFDVELMRYQNIEEELVRMLQIALSCVAKVPDQRPNIEKVIQMIEEASLFGSEHDPSLDKSKDFDD